MRWPSSSDKSKRGAASADCKRILDITHEWHQTNEMETLLVRMAEAATRLLDADRASIFLWDKSNEHDCRPAGARRARWRTATAR